MDSQEEASTALLESLTRPDTRRLSGSLMRQPGRQDRGTDTPFSLSGAHAGEVEVVGDYGVILAERTGAGKIAAHGEIADEHLALATEGSAASRFQPAPVWSITPNPQQLSKSPRVGKFALARRRPAIACLQ